MELFLIDIKLFKCTSHPCDHITVLFLTNTDIFMKFYLVIQHFRVRVFEGQYILIPALKKYELSCFILALQPINTMKCYYYYVN